MATTTRPASGKGVLKRLGQLPSPMEPSEVPRIDTVGLDLHAGTKGDERRCDDLARDAE
jgi:hypothetical protein